MSIIIMRLKNIKLTVMSKIIIMCFIFSLLLSCQNDDNNIENLNELEPSGISINDQLLNGMSIDPIAISYLASLKDFALKRTFLGINGKALLQLKDGELDESRMSLVYHYTFDWELLRNSETINLDDIVVFNDKAITVLFFNSEEKKEVIGFVRGDKSANDKWTHTYVKPQYLYSIVDDFSYFLEKQKEMN